MQNVAAPMNTPEPSFNWEYISKEDYITENEAQALLDELNEQLESVHDDVGYYGSFVYYNPLGEAPVDEIEQYDVVSQEEQDILDQIAEVERKRLYSQKEEKEFERYTFGEETKEYDIIFERPNEGVDPEKGNDMVTMALAISGVQGEKYAALIDEGKVDIQITGYKERELTQEEAEALYYKEHERDKTAISFVISSVEAMVNPKKFTDVFLDLYNAAKKEYAGEDEDLILDNTISAVAETLLGNAEDVKTLKSNIMSGIAKDIAIDAFLDGIEQLNYDVNNIQGGSYVEAQVSITSKAGGNVAPYTMYVRGVEKYGSYVLDINNPVCRSDY